MSARAAGDGDDDRLAAPLDRLGAAVGAGVAAGAGVASARARPRRGAARRARGAGAIGSAFPASAISACPVTQTGVWVLVRE